MNTKTIWTGMAIAAASLVSAMAEEAPKAFVMPVQASTFEIETKELLSMGENALSNGDYLGAVNYFSELREKVSAAPHGSDYFLSSALLAEACLGLPQDKEVKLKKGKQQSINPRKTAEAVFDERIPKTVSEDTRIYWQFVQSQLYLTTRKPDVCLGMCKTLQGDSQTREVRLKDLVNWVLITEMQALAMKAENSTQDTSELWNRIIELSSRRIPKVTHQGEKNNEDNLKTIPGGPGELLKRSPRKDVLEVEFVRLRAYAYLELEQFEKALDEYKKDCMAVYAEERNWLLAACHARLSRTNEANAQYARCMQEYKVDKTSTERLQRIARKTRWALFDMDYKAGEYDSAEQHLDVLGKELKDGETYKWLMLRLNTLEGRLKMAIEDVTGQNDSSLAVKVEQFCNTAMSYSILFPDSCKVSWKKIIDGFSADRKAEYMNVLVRCLYALGQLEKRLGNVNLAIEIFDRICHSEEIDDAMRYESGLALGDSASFDIRKSIEAFKLCEGLKNISVEKKAIALYKAAQRSLEVVRTESSLQKNLRDDLGKEAIKMLKRLCFEYTDTQVGLEASLCLADYLYELKSYSEASAFYERYFMSGKCEISRRDFARLRWGRCWRLLAEEKSDTDAALDKGQLQKAYSVLDVLCNSETTSVDTRNQALLEAYRIAFFMGNAELAHDKLDMLIELNSGKGPFSEIVWIGLYERMLGHYQRLELDYAEGDGELFLQMRGDSMAMTPWAREFYVLFGDVLAAGQHWERACQMYLKLELLDKADSGDELMQYSMLEAAHCYVENRDYTKADELLERVFFAKGKASRQCLYQAAMLQGNSRMEEGKFQEARKSYERAQAVYGAQDTFRSSLAKCKQGEMLLMEAELLLKNSDATGRTDALRLIARASEIFSNLLEQKGKDGTSGEQDHFLDLYLRAQMLMGECYEALMNVNPSVPEARENAIWAYKRIGDYFIARHKAGLDIRSSKYYVQSVERRVRLLAGDDNASNDALDTVARLYEEYAQLKLPGSAMAEKRVEELRKKISRAH